MNKRIALGLDFGTESGRVILVDGESGRELATVVKNYPHGVIDSVLPNGKTRLEPEWALQHPMDYLTVAQDIIPEALKQAGVRAEDIVGIGVDFTSCTILPTRTDGKPLCLLDEFKDEPHAWVKLWKHHAA
ncbi:MAG: ribulokinase, partial [Calditrichaeota bacterium]|nr:ribulokinase [Calditrichota bacterium]